MKARLAREIKIRGLTLRFGDFCINEKLGGHEAREPEFIICLPENMGHIIYNK